MTTLRCISPIDGSVFLEREPASENRIEASLAEAKGAQEEWARAPLGTRARLCGDFVDAMLAMRDEIVPELAWQMGRPVRFGGGELGGFEERARAMIDLAEEALSPIRPPRLDGLERYVERVALGTVFIIAPWNYPYLTAVNSVVPALMAGNAVVLKHATQTLGAGERFASAAEAAGLPVGLFTNLALTHAQATRIIQDHRVQQVNFTGSVGAGRAIERAAAGHFLGVGLELGGKDPAYVRADCQLEHAIENLADGAFFNSGQSCCGIERIYVDEAVHAPFVEGLVAAVERYVLGDPLAPETTLGPCVHADAADFVRGQIETACAAGARALVDPRSFERDASGSAYMAPQVVVDVDHGMELMTEESFGPVVGVMKVSSDDEAVSLMNDSAYGLSASIWTRDLGVAERLGRRLETGTVFANRCDYLDPMLAWTGVKDTGKGATLSRVGYETLTRPRSFHLRSIE